MSLPLLVVQGCLSVETTRSEFIDVLLVAEVLPLNYTRILIRLLKAIFLNAFANRISDIYNYKSSTA